MMDDEQTKELIKRAQAGDCAARDMILSQNLNLVRSVVHRFSGRGYEWDDLFQIGCIGLIKSVERFDSKYSVRFSTYAVPMIIGEIRRFLRDDSLVKVSRPLKELAYRVHKAQEKLQGVLGRDPSIGEVAAELAISTQEIVAALEAVQPPASLHEPSFYDDGDAIERLQQIKVDNQDDVSFDSMVLREVLARLPPRERLVIHLRYFEDQTQAEIAASIGLSQVQISRIEKQALKLIREFLQTS
ncbi:MAG: SigF/SigG family RNA polymerase sporulation sigma factor [Negativicutes bacterium]|nr:SigF/SigG family RNA polymerase sporulation sigma factor [Negativicutes bacterium]